MFGRNLKLFTIFGFDVRVNVSWTFLALLIALSLALGFFPRVYEGWPAATYWWMAAGGVVGVFFSIVLHELSHSLTARVFGTGMTGITLFLFGGVAEMESEPATAKAEFWTAIAGPAISLALAGVFLALAQLGGAEPTPVTALLDYLGWLNIVLAVFNLVPAYPLDGGRVLRAILWGARGDLRWATKWASGLGGVFGVILMLCGAFFVLVGAFVQGLWWFLIGMFLRGAAQASYQQMEVRRLMGGVTVGEVMETDPHAVSPDLAISDLVERYVYEYRQSEFPVAGPEGLIGVVGADDIKKVPRANWPRMTVRDIMTPIDKAALVEPSQDVVKALESLHRTGDDSLIVARDGRALGILSRADVMKLLGLKMELEAA